MINLVAIANDWAAALATARQLRFPGPVGHLARGEDTVIRSAPETLPRGPYDLAGEDDMERARR